MKIKVLGGIILNFFVMAQRYTALICFILALNASEFPPAITDDFKAQGGMSIKDPLLLESFADRASESAPENPFLLVAIPAAPVYHFFDSRQLYAFWAERNKGDYFDPLNKTLVTSLFVFKYKGGDTEFPFDHVETLDHQELTKRMYTKTDFDEWLEKSKKRAATWIMSRLTKKFTKPTRQDLKQIYHIIGAPVDEAEVEGEYVYMFLNSNPVTRYLITRADRRYTDARLRNFIARRGFPFDEQKFLNRYNQIQTGVAYTPITLTFLHLGHTDHFQI
jgi:hypothetical protein